MKLSPSDIARYWRHVDKSNGPLACWNWRKTSQYTHGHLKVSGQYIPCTHIALTLVGKPRPSSHMWALHTCDVLGCVQPLHLYWGTRQDNTQDAVDRNRYKHGEQHHNAKLTKDKVLIIRNMINDGMTDRQIAECLDVASCTVRDIRHGKTWRHVV